jgi:hypothetical protein
MVWNYIKYKVGLRRKNYVDIRARMRYDATVDPPPMTLQKCRRWCGAKNATVGPIVGPIV